MLELSDGEVCKRCVRGGLLSAGVMGRCERSYQSQISLLNILWD